jgi:hypothetical protein
VLIAIRAWHIRSDGTYGAPRLLGDLREAGLHLGQKRIAPDAGARAGGGQSAPRCAHHVPRSRRDPGR